MSLSTEHQSLEALILAATNPLVKHEDPNAVQAVVQAANCDTSAPQTVVRLLAHKIHSPQENEAMKALSVIQACMINCGGAFHSEVGKFRFLNEMIKLVSPKYSGNSTSAAIKSRVIELLFCWMTDLPQEPKIAEAYNMLKKQCIIQNDPMYIGPLQASLPAPRSTTLSSIEDKERSELLHRLLQSKRPEDLDRANALIKAMVRDDQRKLEQATHAAMEVEMARNNVKVLDEMLNEHEKRGCSSDASHVSLMTELEHTCNKLRGALYNTIAQCTETDTDLGDMIACNEELTQVIGRYKALVVAKKPEHSTNENAKVSAKEQSAEMTQEGGPDMLLDLSYPSAVSAASTDLLQQQLSTLELLDTTAPPTASAPLPVSSEAASESSIALLEQLEESGSLFSRSTAPAANSFGPESSLIPPLLPFTAAVSSRTDQDRESDEKPLSHPLDALDVLGSSLLQSSLPPNTLSAGQKFKQPEKLTINQLKQKQTSLVSTLECASSKAASQGFSSSEKVLMDANSGIPASNACFRKDSLTSQKTCDIKTDVNLNSAADRALPHKFAAPDLIATVPSFSSTDAPKAPSQFYSSSQSKAQFLDVKPLTDIKIQITDILPSTRAPLTLLDTATVSTVLHYTRNAPREDVAVFVVTTSSHSTEPLENYVLQAVVPRACKVRLLTPSSTTMPQYSPFLPPPAITQIILVANPNQVNVSLKLMLSYTIKDDSVTEMAELDNLDL